MSYDTTTKYFSEIVFKYGNTHPRQEVFNQMKQMGMSIPSVVVLHIIS